MEVISNTAGIMLELHNRLVATEERALSAEARARAAEADAKDAMCGS